MNKRMPILIALIILCLLPSPALADNCGSLSDCFRGNMLPAILLILGLLLLIGLIWYFGIGAAIGVALRGLIGAAARVVSSRILGPIIRAILTSRLKAGTGGLIQGFTREGILRTLTRDKVGVATKAIIDAVKNPIKTIPQTGGRIRYEGKDATIILNKIGKIITTWANNSKGWRWWK